MQNEFPDQLYCNSLTHYSRLVTREVNIGDVKMGGNNPIRVQSMTTTDTMDTLATVEQSVRMIEAGCEYVRITAPSINEARNLENIKNELRRRGYDTPLIADIHFTPNAAEAAARIVEKVRINPGNFADKKKFENIEYTDSAYTEELERIRKRFVPLVKICKEYGTAMRIGTNHGSLSDRIMSRYGDTPLGMVESALEFLRICEAENFNNIVLSMKSSNPQVMVQAYRLLILKMHKENMNYPLHLGVTEAGEGEDGRIKSAAGIGTLLEDGIGDTIRVSLTEDPEFEIPVAKALVKRYENRANHEAIPEADKIHIESYHPYEYIKRKTLDVNFTGGSHVPKVISDLSGSEKITPASLFGSGYAYSIPLDKWNISDQACDFIYTGSNALDFEIPGTLSVIMKTSSWKTQEQKERHYPLFTLTEFISSDKISDDMNFVLVNEKDVYHSSMQQLFSKMNKVVVVLNTDNLHAMASLRRMFLEMNKIALNNHLVSPPVIILREYVAISADDLQLNASTDFGGLFLDGFGDGIWIKAGNIASASAINALSFGILQACRQRISKTEYISCPSCGRTLFNLQETTAQIRMRTSHLKGLKIGIMGCIVNGPGEMADADYGYVGSGPGKITLYKGKEVVMRNVETDKAVEALIDLIKEHGDWVEMPELV
ncbi:MAG: (E)-4-hydroxy-3-methylbut-2-enyl-diphosphate synthase [Bacteroidota bacterium]